MSDTPKDLVTQSKKLFLQEVQKEFEEGQFRYDLVKEFAKTKKNRSYSVRIVLGIASIILVVGAILISNSLRDAAEAEPISAQELATFESINLRDLLDQVKRFESEKERLEARLVQLALEENALIENVISGVEQDVEILRAQGRSEAEINRLREDLEAEAETEIAAIQADYEQRRAEVQAQLDEVLDQMAAYDTRQMDQARRQEELLDNQRKVFELERNQLIQEHNQEVEQLIQGHRTEIDELQDFQADVVAQLRATHANELARTIARYNPNFTSGEVADLLQTSVARSDWAQSIFPPFENEYAADGAFSQDFFNGAAEDAGRVVILLNALLETPYINDVHPVLERIGAYTATTIDQLKEALDQYTRVVAERDGDILELELLRDRLGTTIASLNSTVARREAEVDRLSDSLQLYLGLRGDDGIVVRGGSSDAVVYIDSYLPIAEGDEGYVFRKDDEYLGKIRISSIGREVVADIVQLEPDTQFQPFDVILMEISPERREGVTEAEAAEETDQETSESAESTGD